MGKIANLPDAERLAIIGYLAQEGVVKEITAEVPLRISDEFQEKYGIKPYIIKSDKKYSVQYRIYLTDPDSAPPALKEALDYKYQRLNDSAFVEELVDKYGFTFFGKQNCQEIVSHAKLLQADSYDSFLEGYNTNTNFISSLNKAVSADNLPMPEIIPVTDEEKKGNAKKKKNISDSNGAFTEEQLLILGWSGEEYLYKVLTSGNPHAFDPFCIDSSNVIDVIWFNQGYHSDANWTDKSVGKGCDLCIKTIDSELFVEVKSSRRRSPIFAMTSFEMLKMKEKRQDYYLAKIDYLENIISGLAPSLKVFNDPYDRFFDPMKMQKAVFYYY